MSNILLTSSNYGLCIGTASLILALQAYGVYTLGISPLWNAFGMTLFTLNEYLSHRFILHYAHEGDIYYYLHGKHHYKPFGKSIHIPILYTSTIVILFTWILSYISWTCALNSMLAYQVGYIFFEHIHMEVHHPKHLLKNYMFRAAHIYHHTRNKQKSFAFSVPTWDIVFGTFPDEAFSYNWFAYVPIPLLSYEWGTKQLQSPPHSS